MIYIDLIHNTALLVALSSLYNLLSGLRQKSKTLYETCLGILFGAVTAAGMMVPFRYSPGIIYDGRSIVLSMAGLFGGSLCAAVSSAIAAAYRLYIGGAGVWAGIATIGASAAAGVICRRIYDNKPEVIDIPGLYLFGTAVHLAMLGCQLLIKPWPSGVGMIGRIWLPVMTVYPVATVLMGLLLSAEERRAAAYRELARSRRLLRGERDMARSYLYVAGAMIGILDSQGRVVMMNRKGCEILGYKEEEIANANWFELCLPENARQDTRDVFEKILGGDEERFEAHENTVLTKSGDQRTLLFQNALLRDDAGLPWGVLFSGVDITDLKKREQELRELAGELELRVERRTAELKDANRELESFAYSVSHDLRAPLRACMGFARILSERHGENLDDEGRRYLGYIVEAGENMSRLIDDILTYSRLGRQSVALRPVGAGEVADRVLRTLSERIESSGAVVRAKGDFPAVLADPGLLERALLNLVDNALKYHKPETPPHIEIFCTDMGDRLRIVVKDSGIGIDPRFFDKIFEMFQRLQPQDKYPGTGIGLALVARCARLMAGSCGVESEPGKGSEFWIELPKA